LCGLIWSLQQLHADCDPVGALGDGSNWVWGSAATSASRKPLLVRVQVSGANERETSVAVEPRKDGLMNETSGTCLGEGSPTGSMRRSTCHFIANFS
jgi:hypothetical protein